MTAHELLRPVHTLIDPSSSVIIGPSVRSAAVVRNMLASKIPVMGVHPNKDDVLGLKCLPSIESLESTPELAVVMVGHTRVEEAVYELMDRGTRAFFFPGLGSEAGADGPLIAARIRERAAANGSMIIGQNCMGIAKPGGSPWIGSISDSFVNGHVGISAQSGSIAEAFTTIGPRIGFRFIASTGSELNRDVSDFMSFMADDEETRAVGIFIETIRRPDAFIAALEKCAVAGKPVVALKVGKSGVAKRIALAHTGAVVGSNQAFSATLRRFSAIEVEDFPEMVETLEVLGKKRRPKGVRVSAVSESGGECGLMADRAEKNGVTFAALPEKTAIELNKEFPNYQHPQNPLDAWGVDTPEVVFPRSMEMLAESGAYDTLIAQVDISRFRGADELVWCNMVVESLGKTAEKFNISPAVVSVHSVDAPQSILDICAKYELPLLRGINGAMQALGHAGRWSKPSTIHQNFGSPIIISDMVTREGALPEYESAEILERYGVPIASRKRVTSSDQAAAVAESLGYPVVVKSDGPAHKSAAGGVILNIKSAEEATAAVEKLGGVAFIAAQIPQGVEALVGMVRDEEFGPILAVGHGGVTVESKKPVTMLGPVDLATAQKMVAEAGLEDPHGVLSTSLVTLGRVAVEHPEIVEIDVNPMIVYDKATIAVDALVVISSENGK
ncbi:COG1042 Acyl-CoA synthetase (NDP forming) [Candidatus Nanopelagicaceae bacterium]